MIALFLLKIPGRRHSRPKHTKSKLSMIESSYPNTLLDMQIWFAKIITSPLQECDQANLPVYQSHLIDDIRGRIASSPQLKSEERIGIYHQQYWWRLISIMQELYPSLVHLFGYEEFNRLIAEPYLLDCPPQDWFLSRIGSNIPDWLKKNYQEKNASLVLELASLDLAYERLIFTEILPKIDPNTLHKADSEILYLQPFVMLFEFDVDFFTFRTKLLEHPPIYWQTHDLPQIKKKRKNASFVLFRKNEKDFYEEISKARFALLSCFQEGAKLIDLTEQLTACDNIIEWFQMISSRDWLSFSKNY